MTGVETIQQAQNLIFEKLRADRPTLREYLRSRAAGEAQSSEQWAKEVGGELNSQWRAGASYAYRDIERMLERDGFAPEKLHGR